MSIQIVCRISTWLCIYFCVVSYLWTSQVMLMVKNLPASVGDIMRHGFDHQVEKIP